MQRNRPPSPPSPGPGQRPPSGNDQGGQRPRPAFSIWWYLVFVVVLLGANFIITSLISNSQQPTRVNISYNQFLTQVKDNNVSEITATGSSITGTTKEPVPDVSNHSEKSKYFNTQLPSFASGNLQQLLLDHNVQINALNPNPPTPWWLTLLGDFGPALLIIVGFLFLTRMLGRAAGGPGGVLGRFGQSQARLYDAQRPGITFADVAGVEDAKQELQEVVDFLREPQKYGRLGGTIPKGVLLVGEPGTGKTLLARAVAGEAGVPFFSIAASEFVEAIVGVGASRVRDLFQKARAAAPAIIFIDELDAIGRSRSASVRLSGNDEQEQTLNQVLTEMDGFDSREGVIVIAATNRSDVLDQALLRPGRFDRQVMVQPPDRRGRAAILRIHTRNVPVAPDVDLDQVASETAGMVGADLRNLVNEAALTATRRNRDQVTGEDFSEAIEKVLLGGVRGIQLTPQDRERTAYHESGHALLGLLVPGADPVRKVTIVPRGKALGVTVQSPVDDRFNLSEEYLRARIIGALGGRSAEKLVYGMVTTGAENDLAAVTQIAQQMVVRWGMSDRVGPLNFADQQDKAGPLGGQAYSESTGRIIDEEVRRIVEECHEEAERLLSTHRDKLDALTQALLKEDSLEESEILQVTGLQPAPVPPGADTPATAAARVFTS
ncbi:MAG: ATP-dependent zinc metalloprotease FtsH [Candidatus Dormibacteraeota bacterium]|nr:ATP-dependent zinc metalloprotease FtsH [Candidatus Dormibacteraeota bacterium]